MVEETVRALPLKELRSFMRLDEDMVSKDGNTLVSKGHPLHEALLERLRNFSKSVGLVEPIRVRIPVARRPARAAKAGPRRAAAG